MGLTWTDGRPLRVLDFDIETRRIGFHSAGRFNPDGCEPVAIAAGWCDQAKVDIQIRDPITDLPWLLAWFRNLWDEADAVTGHYIRRFDLPILNGALLEHGFPLLTPKLVSDTKGDLVAREGMSASQENLSLMFKLGAKKYHMADYDWRAIARLEPDAMEECRKRVISDVRQHKALRKALIKAGALHPPRVWSP